MSGVLADVPFAMMLPAAPGLPLAIAALAGAPATQGLALRLLPLAPLPGLALASGAVLASPPAPLTLPPLLFGVTLGLDPGLVLILAMTGLLWAAAGLSAQAVTRARGAFTAFWAVALTGNMGVLLAQDVLGFYASFAALSLASWGLVVHQRTAGARHAGRVYVALALLGEAALLAGLLVAADLADSLWIADLRDALGTDPDAAVAIGLLVLGFGIKAGMVPLHVWLPLAHPAAPAPASAVLSGAIVKSGAVGLMVFLPESAAASLLAGLGAAGAVFGALWSLTQAQPKAILAYSTVSKMGLMLMLLGAGGAAAELAGYYALHHGLAKGALFLLAGLMAATASPGRRAWVLVFAALCALSLIGAPLTGGALPKAAARAVLPDALAMVISLSSVLTTLAMGWFLQRLWRGAPSVHPARMWPLRLIPPACATLAALALPWTLWTAQIGAPRTELLSLTALLDALWPFLAGLIGLAVLSRRPVPSTAPGDLLIPLRRIRLGGFNRRARAEAALARWSSGGVLTVLAVLALAMTLRFG